jgi:hypothetical protein
LLELVLVSGSGGSQTGAVDELLKGGVEAGKTLALGELTGLRASDDDEVLPGAQLSLHTRERLSQQTLDAIALDGAAHLARHREPQARPLVTSAGKAVEHQMTVGRGAAVAVDALELRAAGETSTSLTTGASGALHHPAGVT